MKERIEFLEKNYDKVIKQFEEMSVLHARKNKGLKGYIKVLYIEKTSFNDGSYWVGYEVDGKFGVTSLFGYEENDIISVEYLFNMNHEKYMELTKEKSNILELSEMLKELINECRYSDNDMYFIEYEDIERFTRSEKKFIQDINLEFLEYEIIKHGLDGFIEIDNDDALVTVYGGAIEKIWFNEVV